MTFPFLGQVYAAAIGLFSLNFATCPLFFELAVESAYPCPEILVGGLLTGANNFVGLTFLFLFFIPNIGKLEDSRTRFWICKYHSVSVHDFKPVFIHLITISLY